MKHLLYLIGISTIFLSCSNNIGRFKIVNQSNFDIDSLSLSPDIENQIFNVNKKESISISIDMGPKKNDGSYSIKFKNKTNNLHVEKHFGYYTNGYQIEKEIIVTIEDDTLQYKSIF